jgi:hypothetical protein
VTSCNLALLLERKKGLGHLIGADRADDEDLTDGGRLVFRQQLTDTIDEDLELQGKDNPAWWGEDQVLVKGVQAQSQPV